MKAQTKKVFDDTVSTMKNQLGEAERVWTESIEQLNSRFQTAEKDARELARRLEADSRDKLNQIRSQIQIENVKSRFDGAELVNLSARFGSETVEKLGLAKISDIEPLAGKLDRLAKKVETVRRRSTEITGLKKAAKDAERAQAKMEKRVAKLEKTVTDLSKKLAAAKKATAAKKAPAKKSTTQAKKSASSSRSSKK